MAEGENLLGSCLLTSTCGPQHVHSCRDEDAFKKEKLLMKWGGYMVSPYTWMQDSLKILFMGLLKLSVKLNSLLLPCVHPSPSRASAHFHGNQIAKEDDYLNTWCREAVLWGPSGSCIMPSVLIVLLSPSTYQISSRPSQIPPPTWALLWTLPRLQHT